MTRRPPNRVVAARKLRSDAEELDRVARRLELAGDLQRSNDAARLAGNSRRGADLLDPDPKPEI
jgi:hypothetical protein